MSLPENELNRDKKALERKYITVVLSDTRVKEDKKFRCCECGRPVATPFNEIKAIMQAKVPIEDVGNNKPIGNLCKECNIMYIFV